MRWLAPLLLAGCASDPDACWFGNERAAGGVCALPELAATLDGDGAEWDDAGIVRWRSCYDCPAGDVDSFQVAREGEDALVLRAITLGPPLADSATYLASFRALRGPEIGTLRGYGFQVLFDAEEIIGRMLPWYEFTGLPVEVAWAADGYELRVPIAVLPFEGAAWFGTGMADGTAGNSLARVCWLPSAVDDACAIAHE